MSLEDAVAKLNGLGINNSEQYAEILKECLTLEDLKSKIIELHLQSSTYQFLGISLAKLFNSDLDHKKRFMSKAEADLREIGILPEYINEFYDTKAGNWDLLFRLRHGNKYSEEQINRLISEGTKFALDYLREYLGLNKASSA